MRYRKKREGEGEYVPSPSPPLARTVGSMYVWIYDIKALFLVDSNLC